MQYSYWLYEGVLGWRGLRMDRHANTVGMIDSRGAPDPPGATGLTATSSGPTGSGHPTQND
jgi:hypothetical protein